MILRYVILKLGTVVAEFNVYNDNSEYYVIEFFGNLTIIRENRITLFTQQRTISKDELKNMFNEDKFEFKYISPNIYPEVVAASI